MGLHSDPGRAEQHWAPCRAHDDQARSTEQGIDPAPERGRYMRWRTFLKADWEAIAAVDFFTVEAVSVSGLVRYFVLIVIDLKSRRVEVAGIVNQPDGNGMNQVARNPD